MTEEHFRESEQLLLSAGFTVEESRYEDQHFGSWWIEASREKLPRQRLVWDGKDRWLIVQALASNGTWMDKWVGRKTSEQSAAMALSQLELPVSREWEAEIERQRAEYWREVQLEQALSTAAPLWKAGCYSEYVRELTPYREQLSPAQLKRLDIAQRRTIS